VSQAAWDRVCRAASDNEPLSGQVVSVVAGGLILDLGGVRGFLPAHLVEERVEGIRPLDEYAGATMRVLVIELNRGRNNCVVSRRAAS
jgi:small subunit ribosomal protein S1